MIVLETMVVILLTSVASGIAREAIGRVSVMLKRVRIMALPADSFMGALSVVDDG